MAAMPRKRSRSLSPSRWLTQAAARAALADAERRAAAVEAELALVKPLTPGSGSNSRRGSGDQERERRGARSSSCLLPPADPPQQRSPLRTRSFRASSPPPRARVLSGDTAHGLLVCSAAAYVPRRVAQLYSSPTPPRPPCCAPLRAVLMFADISGYSALTRWMATRFEQGPWATTQVLDRMFGGMTACVRAHGGDVLKFAGDALLVAWPLAAEAETQTHADVASDADVAHAAAACALAMLRLEAGAPAPGEPPLSLHIALHCGTLAEMHLGDGDVAGGRWEHTLIGAALSELAPLVAAAGSGECVASHALWALLDASHRRCARGGACAGGARVAAVADAGSYALAASLQQHADPPLPPHVLSALERYLPPALADTLSAGEPHGWLAELRRVSVLFVLLPPCGADDFQLAAALVAEVHRCVGRHGGAAQQSLCDDKGTVSIGVWGKPPDSHADDARRCLDAARQLAASLARVAGRHGRGDAVVACGVTTGRAFCGNVGSPQRCEWAVVGESMNSAAALMAAAARMRVPVLCCEATARSAAAAAAEAGAPPPAWTAAEPLLLSLKGAAAPQRVYAPPLAGDDVAPCLECQAGDDHHHHPSTPQQQQPPQQPQQSESAPAGAAHTPALPSPPRSATSSPPLPPRHCPAASAAGTAGAAGTAPAPAPAPLLVGREAELSRVAALLRGGEGALVVVSGGVSAGKTAFLRAAAAEAAAAGLAVLPLAPPHGGLAQPPGAALRTPWLAAAVRRCGVAGLPPPLAPLAPLLATLLPPGCGVSAEALTTPGSAAALAALRPCGNQGFDGSSGSDSSLAEEDETTCALAALAVEVLRPALSAGAVLVADDAGCLDALSASLLAAIHAELRPALLVALPRSEAQDPSSAGAALVAALAAAAPPRACRAVALGPLPPAAVAALCAAELRVGPSPEALPPGLVPALMRLAGGHPLLLQESLALLLRQGHLRVEPPATSPATSAPGRVTVACDLASLPDLVARALAAEADGAARMELFMQRRLDVLGPEARAAVRAAAVLGGEFDLPLIARCCGGACASFAATCAAAAELMHEGLWVHAGGDECGGDDGGGAVRYTFAHEVLRALVFAATPEDARAELHRTVLSCLEESRRLRAPDDVAAAVSLDDSAAHTAQTAQAWAEWGRLARGANQHTKAAACFLQGAQASVAAAAARGLGDAERLARDGLAALRDAAAQRAAAAAATSASATSAPRSSQYADVAPFASFPPAPRLSFFGGGGGGGDASTSQRGRLSAAAAPRLSHVALPRLSTSADCADQHLPGAASGSAAPTPTTPPTPDGGAFPRASLGTPPAAATSADAEDATSSAADDAQCAELRAGLLSVLDTVRRVRGSWALIEPGLTEHALAMTHAFIGRAPSVLELVHGKKGQALTDPEMGPVMVAHQVTLLRLVGTTVAGQKDLDAMGPTLVRCGRMHARFGDTIKDFYVHCGAAMLDTLRGVMGDAFTADVAAAWEGVYEFVATHMLQGIASVETAAAAESGLREVLLGQVVAVA